MFGLLLLFAVVLLTIFIEFRWKQRRIYELAKKLPGYDGLSIIESLVLALRLSRKDYIPAIEKYIKNDAPITKIWLVNFFAILTKDAGIIHKVFNTPQTYDKPMIFYQVFFMDHALTPLGGDTHRRHRQILNKAFSMKILQQLPKIFDEKSKKILKLMEPKIGSEEFDVSEYVGALSLESFGKINLNYEIEYFGSDIINAVKR